MAACFIAAPSLSNPVNPVVVNGAATFNQAGNVLTVTNSNGAIINWDKFSIKAGETTHFAQTAASSSVLNRVLNDPSAIYGTLSSNGRVWLVNPVGIMVGPGGRIDTAAFVASTLNIRNEDFLAGRHLFINDGSAKDIINQGEIRTSAGGSVYLIGSNVSNEGIITTPNGETILAAGNTVSLIDSATPGVKVDITGAEGNSTNLGTITAEAGRIGIAGVIVRNSGTLNASSVVNEGGRIFLKASKDAYVDGNGRIVTTGTQGGRVEVLGNRVAVMDNAEIDASGTGDANGGGGSIKVGGDYQGKNLEVQNSQITYFGPNASLKADATKVGAGGTVIVWADDTTRAYGSISARGGASGGDGGFVETSGKRYLDVAGIKVDASSPKGQNGLWLLDPNNIEIVAGPGTDVNASYGSGIWDTTNDTATVYAGNIASVLDLGTNVTVQTGTSGTNSQYGDITVSGAITKSYGGDASLTLSAHNDIVVGAGVGISSTFGALTVVLNSDSDALNGGAIVMNTGSFITSNGGNITLGGGANPLLNPATGNGANVSGISLDGVTLNAGAGNISLRGTGAAGTNNATGIYATGSTLQTTTGSISLTGIGGAGGGGWGVGVWNLSTALTSTSGDIDITGTGASGGWGMGILVQNSSTVSTGGSGDIIMTGIGGDTGYSNHGVGFTTGSSATTVAGLLQVTGTSNSDGTVNGQDAVALTGASSFKSTSGSIVLDGTNLSGAGYAPGVSIMDGSSVESLGSATISITARSSNAGWGSISNRGTPGSFIGGAFATGAITLTADNSAGSNAIDLTNLTVQTTGAVTLQPLYPTTTIGVAGGAGSFNLSTATLNAIQPGFASFTIGRSDGTGKLTFGSGGSGYSFGTGLTLRAGEIDINGALTTTSGGLTLAAYGGAGATGNITITSDLVADGVMTIQAGGGISVIDAGLASYGAMSLTAGGDITFTGTDRGVLVQSWDSMTVSAGNSIYAYGGTGINAPGTIFFSGSPVETDSSNWGAGVMLSSYYSQTISAGNEIILKAGTVDNTALSGWLGSASVDFVTDGNQSVNARTLKLFAGASGHDNSVSLEAYGSQVITLGTPGVAAGQLIIAGGGDNTATYGGTTSYGGVGSYNNSASISQYSPTGRQVINLVYGGSLVQLTGGAGTGYGGDFDSNNPAAQGWSSNNYAAIHNEGDGSAYGGGYGQVIDFQYGGALTVTGGTSGNLNFASISNWSEGMMVIGSANGLANPSANLPAITLTGGASGGMLVGGGNSVGNGADISSEATTASTEIYGSSISINGGGSASASTIAGASIAAKNLLLQTPGNLTLTGGSSNVASAAPLPGAATAAAIVNDNYGGTITIKAGGDISLIAGSGYGGAVFIGERKGPTTVNIGAYGSIVLSSSANSSVGIGNMAQSDPYGGANVFLASVGDITVTGTATAPVMIGSLYGDAATTSVTLGSEKNISLAYAQVGNQNGGASDVSFYAGYTDVGAVSPYGGNLSFTRTRVGSAFGDAALGFYAASYGGVGGNISFTDGGGAFGSSIDIVADKDLTLTAVNKGVRLQTTTGVMSIAANNFFAYGGSAVRGPDDVNLLGQPVPYAGAGISVIAGTAGQTINVAGTLLLQAGNVDNSYGGGSSYYGGSVTFSSAGTQEIAARSLTLQAGASGHDNTALISAYGAQIINIGDASNAGSLTLQGGGAADSYNNQARIEHGQIYGGDVYAGFGDQTITVNGGGSVILLAGSGTGVLGYYGSDCYLSGAGDLCRGSSNDAAIRNGIGYQDVYFISGGSLSITGGGAGTQNWAGINNRPTAWSQTISGNPDIAVTGGSGGGGAVSYGGYTYQLANDAGIHSEGSGDQNIYANSITLSAGNATYGGAGISNDSGYSTYITTLGNLSMYGGSSSAGDPFAGGVYIANKGGGAINLDVGGDLYLKAGSGTSSPAMIGTIDGAGDVWIYTGGNVSLIADGSRIGIGSESATYGAMVHIYSGGDLTLTGSATRGVTIGSLYDADSATGVWLTAQKDITIGSATGYGALIGVKTPTSGISWVGIEAGSTGYGGNLLLDGNSRINVGGGESGVSLMSANGNITQNAGSAINGGSVSFFADGNMVAVAGNITSPGYVNLNNSAGNISQAAGSVIYGAGVSVYAYGDAIMGGTLAATPGSGIYVESGYSNPASATNLSVANVSGDHVALYSTGNVVVNGTVTASVGDLDIYAGNYLVPTIGNINLGGSTLSAYGDVMLSAHGTVSQTGGAITSSTGFFSIIADGSVSLGAPISAVTGVDVSVYGGDITI
ncbi:MAG: filamentous hemagglutinin N-terminal domain-containing protein, partial [Sulfuritalea sp.]|nr:filamentous hemagglutinin N-terminal domain-containing protein [Sulfuritalea sp.]